MVNVTHNCDNRWTRLKIGFLILKEFKAFFLNLFFNLTDVDSDTQFFCKNHYSILIDILIDIGHDTQFHHGTTIACGNDSEAIAFPHERRNRC